MRNYRQKDETWEENKKVEEESTVDNLHIEEREESVGAGQRNTVQYFIVL
jgi:hypothetical protein